MSELLAFLGPWGQWIRDHCSGGHLRSLRRGEYGTAALYREWRLLAEQHRDNAEGRFARASFKVGA